MKNNHFYSIKSQSIPSGSFFGGEQSIPSGIFHSHIRTCRYCGYCGGGWKDDDECPACGDVN